MTIYLTGALSVIWLCSGFFFFIPLMIARTKYAHRYQTENFWWIPGGKPAVYAVGVIGYIATAGGVPGTGSTRQPGSGRSSTRRSPTSSGIRSATS